MTRNGANGATNIEYEYAVQGNANAISAVSINGQRSQAYDYDTSGAMVFDGRRGLQMSYNIMNLPDSVGNISYIYMVGDRK